MDHRLEANRQAMNVRDAQYSLGNFDQEKQRNAIFSQVNSQLKEQLNLSIDELENLKLLLRRETEEKIRLRRDIEGKEAEWNEEKKVLRDFLSQQQSRLQLVRRAVTSFRRQYDAMTSELRHDVTAMNREMNNVVGRTSSFVLSVAVSEQRSESLKAADERRLKEQHQLELMETKAQFSDQQIELKSRIVELTAAVDRLKSQLKESEDSLLDARTAQTAADLGLSKRDNEIERLKRTLEDLESADEGIRAIARGVLEDARLHGSASTELLRSRSPTTRGNVDSSSGEHQHRENRFVSPSSPSSGRAPSTAAMVEAALQKRDRQLTDLEERSRREIAAIAKDLHAAVNARNDLEDTVAKLTADLNNSVRRREMAEAEQTRAVASLEAANGSRLQLERSHRALGDEIGEAEAMRRRLEMMNGDLQRQRDDLETAKSELEKELERQKEENFRCLKQLDQNEQKITDQTKDLTQLRETVRRINADRETDARHRLEFAESVSLTSAKLRDAETEMSGLRKEKDASIARLNSSIKELQQLNETLTNDKVKFGKVINKLEEENSRLAAEKNSLLATNSGIKDELVHLERTRIDSEAEYSTLLQRFQHSERQRSEATEGLNSSMRERNQLMDRLNAAIRDNQRLVQQLDSAGQGHRNQNEAIERLKRDKEALVCCRAELESKLHSNERDIAHLSKTLEQARAVAGEEFEMRLETAQRRILELEATKRQMEGEHEDLKDGRRQLQADVEKVQLELEREVEEAEKRAVLAEQCLQQSEAEFQKVLQRQKGVFEIDLDRLSKERDSQRREFESTCEQLKLLHEKESEDLRQKLRDEKENALKQLKAVKTEMEDNAVRAEAFRNQLMNKAESEKQELLAKLRQCEDDMKVQSKEMATARREFQDERERDRKTISDHQTELCRLRSNFENASLAHEMEMIEARNQINEACRCRELMMHDLTETKSQLKTAEGVREDLRRELGEWKRKLSNVEGEREELAKEANDLQLRMSQETTEKDLAQRSAAELRLQLTNMEEHRAELSRIVDDFKQRLHQSEADREATEAERDGCRSHLETVERSLRDARSDGVQLQRYVEASQEEQRRRLDDADQETNRWKQAESDARHENNRLKKRLVECQRQLEHVMAEAAKLERSSSILKNDQRLAEDDHRTALADWQRREKLLEDQCYGLKRMTEEANARIGDLQTELSASEGRVRGIEGRLAEAEDAKRLVEFKLCVIVSTIKRTVGLRSRISFGNSPESSSALRRQQRHLSSGTAADGTGCETPSTTTTTTKRETSPSPLRAVTSDVDAEEIQQMVRSVADDIVNAERERDELSNAVKTLTKRLDEAKEELDRSGVQMNSLRDRVKEAHAEKQDLECRLVKTQTALLVLQQAADEADREHRRLVDYIGTMEQNLSAAQLKNREIQEMKQLVRRMENELEEEKGRSRVELVDVEKQLENARTAWKSNNTELEQLRAALENRDTTIQSLRDQLAKEIANHENADLRVSKLQLTVDQMSSSLTSATEERAVYLQRAETLHGVVCDQNLKYNHLQDKATHLERTLATSDQESRLVNEKLFETRVLLNEEKQKNEKLSEEVQRLQFELKKAEMKRAELQKIIAHRQSSEEDLGHRLEVLQSERERMIEQLSQVQRSISTQETTKMESEKVKSMLERTVQKLEREKLEANEKLNRVSTELRKMKERQIGLNDEMKRLRNELQRLNSHSDMTAEHDSGIENERQKGNQSGASQRPIDASKPAKASQGRKVKSRKQGEVQSTSGDASDVSTTSSVAAGAAAFPKSKVDRLISQMNELSSCASVIATAVPAADRSCPSSSASEKKTTSSSSTSSIIRAYSPASRMRPSSCTDLRTQPPSAK